MNNESKRIWKKFPSALYLKPENSWLVCPKTYEGPCIPNFLCRFSILPWKTCHTIPKMKFNTLFQEITVAWWHISFWRDLWAFIWFRVICHLSSLWLFLGFHSGWILKQYLAESALGSLRYWLFRRKLAKVSRYLVSVNSSWKLMQGYTCSTPILDSWLLKR